MSDTPAPICNHEAMLKWIEELETTELPQDKRKLRTRDGYCCLGIACNVLGGPDKWYFDPVTKYYRYPADAGYQATILPMSIGKILFGPKNVDLVPLKETVFVRDAEGVAVDSATNAVALNDSLGLTFKQIAQVLRWTYLNGPIPSFFERLGSRLYLKLPGE